MKRYILLLICLGIYGLGYGQTRTSNPKTIAQAFERINSTQEDASLYTYLYIRDSIGALPDSMMAQLKVLQWTCLLHYFEAYHNGNESSNTVDSAQTDPRFWGTKQFLVTFRKLSDQINQQWYWLKTPFSFAHTKLGRLQHLSKPISALSAYFYTLEQLWQSWPLLQYDYLDGDALLKICQIQTDSLIQEPNLAYKWLQYESSIKANLYPFENPEAMYRERLRSLISRSPKALTQSAYTYYLASSYQRDSMATAVRYAEEAIALAPRSNWAQEADKLIKTIKRPYLGMMTGDQLKPKQANLAMITYQNTPQVKFNLYPIALTQIEDFRHQYKIDSFILTHQPIQTWTQNLPLPEDYQSHSTEIELPPMDQGAYVLAMNYTPSLSDKPYIEYHTFLVTDLVVVYRQSTANNPISGAYVCRGSDGQAIAGAQVIYAYTNHMDKQTKVYQRSKTNKQGFCAFDKIPKDAKYNTLEFFCIYGKDSTDGNLYIENSRRQASQEHDIRIFTDRGAYRPGQSIQFKALAHHKNQQDLLLSDFKLDIKLQDANQREVGTATLYTNDFGAASDSFTLPSNCALGVYQFMVNGDYIYPQIYVEPYHRQNIEIVFDPIEGACRIGDSVSISAQIRSLNGAPLSGLRCRYLWKTNRSYFQNGWFEQDLGGELSPDAQGRVRLRLPLTADSLSGPRPYRFETDSYILELFAESADGENCTETQVVYAFKNVGSLDLKIPDQVDASQVQAFSFKLDNGNGQALEAAIQCRIYKLATPRPYYQKPWNTPELPLIPEAEYMERYPFYQYHYSSIESINQDSLVWANSYNAPQDSLIRIYELAQFPSGRYRCELIAIHQSGDSVLTQRRFDLLNPKQTQVQLEKPVYLHAEATTLKVGDTLHYCVGSAEANQDILIEVKRASMANQYQWIKLKREQKHFSLCLDSNDIGTLQIAVFSIRHHSLSLQESQQISVIDTAKVLHIRVEQIRDRMQAGTPQHWRFQLMDQHKLPAKAELLLTLYDASVDFIHPLNWERSIFRPEPRSSFGFRGVSFYFYTDMVLMEEPSMRTKASGRMNSFGMVSKTAQTSVEAGRPTGSGKSTAVRSQLHELAFFHPQLRPDSTGFIDLHFTAPESLSRWRLLGLASGPNREFAYLDQTVSTYKNLMIFPNLPAVLRQGDTIDISVRISNTRTTSDQGWCSFSILNDSLDLAQLCSPQRIPFQVDAQSSTIVQFRIAAQQMGQLRFEIKASTDRESDGERNAIDIIDHQSPIILTRPVTLDSGEQISVQVIDLFEKHTQREHSRVQIDIAVNPLWYVLEALASKTQNKDRHSSNQVLNDYIVYALGAKLTAQHPSLASLLGDQMRSQTGLSDRPEVLMGALHLSPWDSHIENERWKRLASFYDVDSVHKHVQALSELLATYQNSDGGFSWLPQSHSDLYTSVYIAQGLARLQQQACALPLSQAQIEQLLKYLDQTFDQRIKPDPEKAWNIFLTLDYVYARVQFPQKWDQAFWVSWITDHHLDLDIENRAQWASTLIRLGQRDMADSILKTILAQAVKPSPKLLFWRKNTARESKQSQIRRHVLIYEALQLHDPNAEQLAPMLQWLIDQKRTQDWESKEATLYATYCILNSGRYDLKQVAQVQLLIDQKPYEIPRKSPGFLSLTLNADSLSQSTLSLQNQGHNPLWAGIFTSFITPAAQSLAAGKELKITKRLVRREPNGSYTTLIPNAQGLYTVTKGDLLSVQLVIEADRDYSYIALSDDRAACVRPQERKSGYRFQGNVHYYCAYERDQTYIYIPTLSRGVHQLSYPIVVTQSGVFGEGFAQIQCQYAPEFSGKDAGHSIQSHARSGF